MSDLECLEDLTQAVRARAAASDDFTQAAFADFVGEALVDSGAVEDFERRMYSHRGVRVDGYGFADAGTTLDLFVIEYSGSGEPESLTRATIDQCVRKVQTFFDQSLAGKLEDGIDVAHPAWGLARQIRQQADGVGRVRVHVLSDSRLSANAREVPATVRDGRDWEVRVWDLVAICRMMTSGEPEEIVIDFAEMFGTGLACLPANSGTDAVVSYLTVVRGDWLAEIYGRYGGRLLEQNVRAFLQLKGGVNKGIRRTILEAPGMFFAYNNGISATAAEAEFDEHGDVVICRKLRHLQIVNGGQTTASIFNVLKKDKDSAPNLAVIRVPMKLSVVKPDLVAEVVPKISEYANSQNKVSAADFFSNHPFHIRIETISRRLWAPAVGSTQVPTHWYYERARGQYLNAAAYLTPAKKREFELTNPRQQLIQKTDLAKVVMTFRGLPNVVSSGAQKNFARFAEFVSDAWKDDGVDFGDDWFRNAVAMTIIFRDLEKAVQTAPWYAQGYRANIVTYSIALLQSALKRASRVLDLGRIWNAQRTPRALSARLVDIGQRVQEALIHGAAANGVVNVTEWAKREKCWTDLQSGVSVVIGEAMEPFLIGADEQAGNRRIARREQRMMNDIEAQTFVVNKGSAYWSELRRWAEAGTLMTPTEMDLLAVAAAIRGRAIPTGPQCKRLVEIERKALDGGFRQ